MKKTLLSILLIAGFTGSTAVLNSCDQVRDVVEDIAVPLPFDIPLSFSTEIPFATVKTEGYSRYPEITMDLDTDAKIKEKYPNLSINNIKSAKLSSLNIELTKALLGGDLTAVKNAKIYLKTPDLAEKLIATAENNTNGRVITFNSTNEELLPYLSSKKNSLILEVQGAKFSLDRFTVNIKPSFKISVGL